jgi:hypothetical protein
MSRDRIGMFKFQASPTSCRGAAGRTDHCAAGTWFTRQAPFWALALTASQLHLSGRVCNNEQEKIDIFINIPSNSGRHIHLHIYNLIIPPNLSFVGAELLGDNAPWALGCSCTTQHAPVEAGAHHDRDYRSLSCGDTLITTDRNVKPNAPGQYARIDWRALWWPASVGRRSWHQ